MHGVRPRPQVPGDELEAGELDERLALAAADGDDAAFARLYERYAARLHGYCWTILRDDANAQDALQSTWLKALVALREGRRAAPVRPWLFRIAHNESISVLRGLRPESGALGLGPAAPSAEEQALRRERLHQVLADLQALPERTRGALVLRELCGLTHQEIALTLQTTVGGAKQSILDARKELREYDSGRDTACAEIREKISAGDRRALRARAMRAHLRHCAGCAAFAAAIEERRSRLLALIPPLAPLVAERVLRSDGWWGGRDRQAHGSRHARQSRRGRRCRRRPGRGREHRRDRTSCKPPVTADARGSDPRARHARTHRPAEIQRLRCPAGSAPGRAPCGGRPPPAGSEQAGAGPAEAVKTRHPADSPCPRAPCRDARVDARHPAAESRQAQCGDDPRSPGAGEEAHVRAARAHEAGRTDRPARAREAGTDGRVRPPGTREAARLPRRPAAGTRTWTRPGFGTHSPTLRKIGPDFPGIRA